MLHTALMVDAFLVRKWSSQGPTSTYQRLHLCQCSASHHRWQFSKSNLDESERKGSVLAYLGTFAARELQPPPRDHVMLLIPSCELDRIPIYGKITTLFSSGNSCSQSFGAPNGMNSSPTTLPRS